MKDLELYQQILGLVAPWSVESVSLKLPEHEVEVRVVCADTVWGCPQCRGRMHIHGWEERRWRHLDSCQFQTILVAQVPQVKCPEHGTQTVAVPWAEKYARFSRLFERFAIDVMLECSIAGLPDFRDQLGGIRWHQTAGGQTRLGSESAGDRRTMVRR